jgi:hypothetical protein
LNPEQRRAFQLVRYNKEIYTLYGDPELSTVIKLRRLQWGGHVQRMESQSVPRMVIASQMFGKRPEGKPKKRWTDAMKEDSYQILKWMNLEVKAQELLMEVENQEGQGPLWAVVPLMMMR